MTGARHVKLAAATWLTGCALAELVGVDPDPAVYVAGTAVCVGFALVSDLDHEDSALVEQVGRVTRWLGRGSAAVGMTVYHITKTSLDRPTPPAGQFVHSPLWLLLWIAVTVVATSSSGPWTVAVLTYAAVHLAIQAALPAEYRQFEIPLSVKRTRRKKRTIGVPVSIPFLAAAVLAAGAYRITPGSAWWLTLAVVVGILAHNVLDALTGEAFPWAAPVPLRNRTWKPMELPAHLRFAAGSPADVEVVQPACILAVWASSIFLAWPVIGPTLAAAGEAIVHVAKTVGLVNT